MAKDGVEVVSALTTSNSKHQMVNSALPMHLMQHAYRHWQSTIPTIAPTLF